MVAIKKTTCFPFASPLIFYKSFMRFLKIIGECRLLMEMSLITLFNYSQSILLLLFSYQMTYEMILGGSLSHEAFERSKSCYFTTKDEDHDTLGDLNCAKDNRGGWWYSDCGWMHLNGPLYRIKRSGWWNHRYIGMCVYNGNFVRWLTYAEMKIRLSC